MRAWQAARFASVHPGMTPRHRETFLPVTLGHIRGHGCRDLLIYCGSGWCNYSAVTNADWLPDETPVGAGSAIAARAAAAPDGCKFVRAALVAAIVAAGTTP